MFDRSKPTVSLNCASLIYSLVSIRLERRYIHHGLKHNFIPASRSAVIIPRSYLARHIADNLIMACAPVIHAYHLGQKIHSIDVGVGVRNLRHRK